MKILKLHIVALLLLTLNAYAQVPQAISYQGVARNNVGQPLANTNVKVRASILNLSTNGTAIYVETQNATTNTNGLFTLAIGNGTATTGTFANIDWANGIKFLKIEFDPTGGTNYVLSGTTQLLSVPYAQFAGNGDKILTLTGSGLVTVTGTYPNFNIQANTQNGGSNGNASTMDVTGSFIVNLVNKCVSIGSQYGGNTYSSIQTNVNNATIRLLDLNPLKSSSILNPSLKYLNYEPGGSSIYNISNGTNSGKFAFNGVPSGTYKIEISKNGYQPDTSSIFTIITGGINKGDIGNLNFNKFYPIENSNAVLSIDAISTSLNSGRFLTIITVSGTNIINNTYANIYLGLTNNVGPNSCLAKNISTYQLIAGIGNQTYIETPISALNTTTGTNIYLTVFPSNCAGSITNNVSSNVVSTFIPPILFDIEISNKVVYIDISNDVNASIVGSFFSFETGNSMTTVTAFNTSTGASFQLSSVFSKNYLNSNSSNFPNYSLPFSISYNSTYLDYDTATSLDLLNSREFDKLDGYYLADGQTIIIYANNYTKKGIMKVNFVDDNGSPSQKKMVFKYKFLK